MPVWLFLLLIFTSFAAGAALAYNYLRKRQDAICNKYRREMVENYNLELQNKWLKESIDRYSII